MAPSAPCDEPGGRPRTPWRERLFDPVDIAALVYFRVLFGAVMLVEVWRYFHHDWIRRYFIDPEFLFTYFGFEWVRPWPGGWMYVHFLALGVLAALILVGCWYRIAAALFFLGFAYVFLLEQANYLNHFYLVGLLSLLSIFLPANRALSLDVARGRVAESATTPAWTLWILRAQLAIVYFFGGVAKLNADWLRGEPMRTWLRARTDFPIIGRFFEEEWMVHTFTYGGLLLDLLIAPLLLWRRTRLLAFVLAVGFHLLNARLFDIGIFPWFMIGATALFFRPDWPRFGGFLRFGGTSDGSGASSEPLVNRRLVTAALAAYLGVQVFVPLRHYAYPGSVHWTEEGHRFAWHMMLRGKSGTTRFRITDPQTRESWVIDPAEYLTERQEERMSVRPDMILQFAHHLASLWEKQGHPGVEVRANAFAELNDHPRRPLIDQRVDLARVGRSLATYDWILPLAVPPK